VGNPLGRPPKQRKSGYYWVHWSYSGNKERGDVWRIAFYLNTSATWSITGDLRFYRDSDFIAISKTPIGYYWPVWDKILLFVSWGFSGFAIFLSIINLLLSFKHRTK
jgi:hypothetical protein